tara:strand:- start:38 stop:625 length:588 start_codon:yes stop_codon:yes gene_type:complete
MDSIKDQEGAGSKQGKSVKTRREYLYDGKKILESLKGQNLFALPMSKIIVPAGLSFVSWHTKKSEKIDQSGGGNMFLGENPLLNSWIDMKGLEILTPETLIPLGIAILTYNIFSRNTPIPKKKEQTGGGDTQESLLKHPVSQELIKVGGVSEKNLRPSLLVPFGMLMGRDVFKALIYNNQHENKKKVKGGADLSD